MDSYQSFIHTSRYARWLSDEQRRERWPETVNRLVSYLRSHIWDSYKVVLNPTHEWELRDAILAHATMPSMRAMMTAGPALDRCHVAAYNCAYLPIDDPRSFDEMLYILMCGTGVGFSVERDYVSKLPVVPPRLLDSRWNIIVDDSKEGWATALQKLMSALYSGCIPTWDLSLLRPAGAILKTFGGRSSGPAPLDDLFNFVVEVFRGNQGRKLSSLNCHDIACKIGDCVVVGGVRRSALISLSNLQDQRIRDCKSGDWYRDYPYRGLANNSVCYSEKPDVGTFMREWQALYASKSGERGVFNRAASTAKAAENGRRVTEGISFGTNPCSEIILRPYQFCNLTEVVARKGDTLASLESKAKKAAILGTLQSTMTDFKYLRPIWKKNTEEERLLGVSITGIYDCPLLTLQNKGLDSTLEHLRDLVIETNKQWSAKLGIPQSVATTCVKPSGTVSQLVDAASGIHPRHSAYYIRRVRADSKDPLAAFMVEQGLEAEDDVYRADGSVKVFSFPVKAPEGATTRETLTALDHLELWKVYAKHWCEHKPSITVSVREDEWLEVGSWVYKNFDAVSGISFLPYSEHSYAQAPYEQCTQQQYEALVANTPVIDYTKFDGYEAEDHTAGAQTMACSADSCEIVDLT